jgi:hypothetical protein
MPGQATNKFLLVGAMRNNDRLIVGLMVVRDHYENDLTIRAEPWRAPDASAEKMGIGWRVIR